MNKPVKSIAFITPYPLGQVASQRFRFEQYFTILKKNGYQLTFFPFLNAGSISILHSPGNRLDKSLMLLSGIWRRLKMLFALGRVDYLFIHREIVPVGPPVFEWLISHLFKKKMIYDFDDAIWTTDRIKEPWFNKIVKWRRKVSKICKWSYKVSCGNDFLGDYARQFNKNVVINPTTIDTEFSHNPKLIKKDSSKDIIIGWTGSQSTLRYLNEIEVQLQEIERKYNYVKTLVIANQKPRIDLKRMEYISWEKSNEIVDLSKIDIGIMPLPNDEWTKGKCGFKALQYMAMEIPCIASNVGVNSEIIDHGETGFLATENNDWTELLNKLINDQNLRIQMGRKGRERVVEAYSVVSNTAKFLSLFE